MTSSYKYKGVLGKPFPWDELPLGLGAEEKVALAIFSAAYAEKEAELHEALFRDCDVERDDPNGWRQVALSLARRHIRAFQPNESKGRGRREEASIFPQSMEVAELMGSKGLSIKSAAAIVAKRHGVKATLVESRFHTMKKAGKRAKAELEKYRRDIRAKQK